MPLVQVRDFPEELYEQLQDSARAEHRSVPQQVIALVERSIEEGRASERSSRQRARADLFREIASDPPRCKAPEGFPDDAELVRRGREGR